MARYEPQNLLAYRVNGDTLDAFGMKYNQALLRIFQFLNDEREHRTTGTETVEPQPGQLKVEDEKLYIRDSANESWVLLGKIASHLGLTPSDVGAVANTGKLGAFKGGASADIPSTATEGDFYWCTDKQTVLLYTEDKWRTFLTLDVTKMQNYDLLVKQDETSTTGGTAGKVARTNANGILDFDISGNAGKLAGVNVAIDHMTDGQTFVYRAATNTITNEDKGVVGSGKTLTIKDGDTTLITYAGEEETELDLGKTAHDESLTAHASLLGSIFRQPSTAYAVGDVVYVKGAGVKYYLLCVTAGTTGGGDITLPSPIAEKDTVTDGTVVWTIRTVASTADIPAPVDVSGKANVDLDNLSAAGLALIQQYGGGIITGNLANNGYVKFQNGLIMQWGYSSKSMGNNETITITYPTPFTNFVIPQAIPVRTGGSENGMMTLYQLPTLTSAVFLQDGDHAELGFFWFAIGK